jgi:hypothetical protein
VVCTVGALQISFSTVGFDTVCLADAAFQLNATPAGGTFSGTGVSGNTFDPSTANAGNNAITYTYTDTAASCTGSITQTVYVSDCVGITEAHAQNLVAVYPNPANDQLNIDLHLTAGGTVTVQLIDVLGQIVYTSSNEQNAGDSSLHLNTANLPRGVYMLSVKTANGTLAKKVELN